MKELDKSGLEFVKLDADKRISKISADDPDSGAQPPRIGRSPDKNRANSKKRGMWNRGKYEEYESEDNLEETSQQSQGSAE